MLLLAPNLVLPESVPNAVSWEPILVPTREDERWPLDHLGSLEGWGWWNNYASSAPSCFIHSLIASRSRLVPVAVSSGLVEMMEVFTGGGGIQASAKVFGGDGVFSSSEFTWQRRLLAVVMFLPLWGLWGEVLQKGFFFASGSFSSTRAISPPPPQGAPYQQCFSPKALLG